MSMFADRIKMKPTTDLEELHNFKFSIGDDVVVGKRKGKIESNFIQYCRRYYNVSLEGLKNQKVVVETEISKAN